MITPEDLIKAIPSWTLKDVMRAIEGIKETFGLSDMALAAAAPATAAPATAAPVAEEKTEFSVFLTGFGEGKKLPVIKVIRAITGASLGDAKKIVEELTTGPYEVKVGVPKAEADELKKQIEETGGIVEVK